MSKRINYELEAKHKSMERQFHTTNKISTAIECVDCKDEPAVEVGEPEGEIHRELGPLKCKQER